MSTSGNSESNTSYTSSGGDSKSSYTTEPGKEPAGEGYKVSRDWGATEWENSNKETPSEPAKGIVRCEVGSSAILQR